MSQSSAKGVDNTVSSGSKAPSNPSSQAGSSVSKPTNAGIDLSHLTEEQRKLIENAENISTAKPHQSTVPRDLNEQIFWKQVQENPANGQILPGMNKDSRFPVDAGFQKMQAIHKLPDGSNIIIHYQYNFNTGKAYDMKIDSLKPKWPQPGVSLTDK
ncbi:hypothetical protein RCS94_04895 [Orbaceae bacterium ac157xtp]